MSGDVADRIGKLRPAPLVDDLCAGEFGMVDVDDACVRSAEFVDVCERVRVNFFGERESVSAGFREADELLQPGRTGGFEV